MSNITDLKLSSAPTVSKKRTQAISEVEKKQAITKSLQGVVRVEEDAVQSPQPYDHSGNIEALQGGVEGDSHRGICVSNIASKKEDVKGN